MLLVTYDDTGGWYDHGELPVGVPAPDDIGFSGGTYTWLGLRSPSLLISPWISKGKVIHEPDGPYPDSQYEHSSISATLKNLFGLPNFLTARDAWAGSLENELDVVGEPRTDCPMHLPDPPAAAVDVQHFQGATHGGVETSDLTRRHKRRMEGLAAANMHGNKELASKIEGLMRLSQSEAEDFIAEQEAIHRRAAANGEL